MTDKSACTSHTAFLYDRGGERQLGVLAPLSRVKWGRVRDDISEGQVFIASPGADCLNTLGLLESGRVELVIFRGGQRVWEGPVVRVAHESDSVEIVARDVMQYTVRTVMHNEYDNRYPNNGPVLTRVKRIMDAELARKEALDPPINVLQYVNYIYSTPPITDAGTAAWTKPFEMTVFNHIDTYAARGGIDYTTVGRSILFFDVHQPIGQTPLVTGDDFIGGPIITQYGMELGTTVYVTDGQGNHGSYGGNDPFYGEHEILHMAYDESTSSTTAGTPPTVTELTSQARRTWSQSHIPPTVVRIPDNTRVNPQGALTMEMLVPGVNIPFTAKLPGRTISQMQRLDKVTVEETAKDGEVIQIVMSPAAQQSS